MAWSDWAAGVLNGIAAPNDPTNIDTLWAWSNAESGSDVMRWNNPLNTTQPWPNAVNMNSVGVKAYATENDGMAATVTTLLNGFYPTILANFRTSLPRQQWQNACANLGTWGTGCAWIALYYGAAPGTLGGPTLTNADLIAVHDSIQDDLWGLIDTSTQSQNDFIFAVNHGTSVQSIIDGWKQNPQYAKWQAAKATIGQTAGQASLTPDEVRQLSEVDSLVAIANALKAELDTVQAKLTKDLA